MPEAVNKECRRCGEAKPYYCFEQGCLVCRVCRQRAARERRLAAPKTCPGCNVSLPGTAFAPHAQFCRLCVERRLQRKAEDRARRAEENHRVRLQRGHRKSPLPARPKRQRRYAPRWIESTARRTRPPQPKTVTSIDELSRMGVRKLFGGPLYTEAPPAREIEIAKRLLSRFSAPGTGTRLASDLTLSVVAYLKRSEPAAILPSIGAVAAACLEQGHALEQAAVGDIEIRVKGISVKFPHDRPRLAEG